MVSLESEEINVLWPNDNLALTFYAMIQCFVKNVTKFPFFLAKNSVTFTFYDTF